MARTLGAKGKRSDALLKHAMATYGRSVGEQLQALVMVTEADVVRHGGLIQAMGARSQVIAASFGLENEQAAKIMMGGMLGLMPFQHARMVDVSHSVDQPLIVNMQSPSNSATHETKPMKFSRMGESVSLDILDLEAVEIKPKQYNEIAKEVRTSSYGNRRIENLTPCNNSGKGAIT